MSCCVTTPHPLEPIGTTRSAGSCSRNTTTAWTATQATVGKDELYGGSGRTALRAKK
jgi:hypothetical protein